MPISKPSNKDGQELRFSDYVEYPIWGFADDDGDEVMPVDYPGYLIAPNGGEVWWVLCEFTFADGTKLPGVIGIRTTNRTPYLLKFPQPDGDLFYFSLNMLERGSVKPEELTVFLKKSVRDIFPFTYTTPYMFRDGKPLAGQYDLPTSWFRLLLLRSLS